MNMNSTQDRTEFVLIGFLLGGVVGSHIISASSKFCSYPRAAHSLASPSPPKLDATALGAICCFENLLSSQETKRMFFEFAKL